MGKKKFIGGKIMNERQKKSIRQTICLTKETLDLLHDISKYHNLGISPILRQLIIKSAQELGIKRVENE